MEGNVEDSKMIEEQKSAEEKLVDLDTEES